MYRERLPADVKLKLAALGIDPDAALAAWLASLASGAANPRLARLLRLNHRAHLRIPVVIPLAVVLPRDDGEHEHERERER